VGPLTTVPRAPDNWVPRSVPEIEGVARTLRLPVVWTRLPIKIEGEGEGVGVGEEEGVGDGVGEEVGEGDGVDVGVGEGLGVGDGLV